jgi:hypothetical protein
MDQTGMERNELTRNFERASAPGHRSPHARGQSADGRGSFSNDLIAVSRSLTTGCKGQRRFAELRCEFIALLCEILLHAKGTFSRVSDC